jgi:hypothetical protein
MALQENEYNSKTGEHELHMNRGSNWYKGRLTEREARNAEYHIHLERMATDEEYRMNWERNEADMKEAMQKHNI